MKKLNANNKIKKILAFMLALALMISCMPSAYTISASEALENDQGDIFSDGSESIGGDGQAEGTADSSEIQLNTLTYEDETVRVSAQELESGAFPENSTLRAEAVSTDTSVDYETVSQKLTALAEEKGSSLLGFSAYEVYLTDSEGNRTEPSGRIQITVEYKNTAGPELADVANTAVTAEKIQRNSETGEIAVSPLNADGDLKILNVSDAKKLETLGVETSSNAAYAVMWDCAAAEPEENSETPELTEEPEITETPEVTEEPEITETPEVTEEPEITETPEVTEEPEITGTPEVTEEPEITETPEVTEEPEITETPEPTEVPAEDVVSDGEDLEQAEPVVYTKQIDNIEVTATADAEVLPEDAQLVVTPISSDTEQYSSVEEQLKAKIENEESSMTGFLAYDIYFTDAEGQKIEPENGKVKVSMAYTEAAIPEAAKTSDKNRLETLTAENNGQSAEDVEISEGSDGLNDGSTESVAQPVSQNETDIAVMHLVEDENGEVRDVVNMTDQGQANVETTENGEIQKAEFETDSFSVFTIVWTVNRSSYTLNVHRVDKNGTEIGDPVSYTGGNKSDQNNIKLETLGVEYRVTNMRYKEAYLLNADGSKTAITYISYNSKNNSQTNGGWFYSADENGSDWTRLGNTSECTVYLVYEEIPEFGQIETVDSKKDGISINLFDYDTDSITSGHQFHFNNGRGDSYDYNNWTGSSAPYKNIMQTLLPQDASGNYTYPTFNIGTKESSGYLFSTAAGTGKTVYADVNKLFTKDADGYYEYDSGTNYAWYNPATEEFEVYNAIAAPSKATAGGYHGNFFPFNKLASDSSYINGTNGIRNLESGTGSSAADFHFGMAISTDFIQRENGQVNGNDMVFDFSGDDDVWVYIDGVLVLDIGGIHDKSSGSINFRTGEAVVNGQKTTLKELFKAAGKTDVEFDGDTFSAYSGHTLNFYYLERGQGASNCKLKFNLTTMPKGTLAVEKKLSNTDKEKYANVEFKFQVMAQEITGIDSISGKEKYSDNYVPLRTGTLSDGSELPYEDGEDNIFKLKPGQQAIFSGLQKDRKYYVREIGVSSDEFDEVVINDKKVTDENGVNASDTSTVGKRPLVIFTNNCSAFNKRELKITKRVNSTQKTTDTFTFHVKLNDKNGNLVDYSGDYYLVDASGNTVKKTTTDGRISGIKDGESIAITQILSGTKFEVTEENLDSSKYETPTYKTAYVGMTGHKDLDSEEVGNTGTIKLYADTVVTVTNTPYNRIWVNKVWKNGSSDMNGTDTVYAGLYKRTEDGTVIPAGDDKYVTLNPENGYSAMFESLDSSEYVVKELRPVTDGETAEFTINSMGYTAADTVVTIGGYNYEITYSDLSTDATDALQKNITITNKRSNKIEVIKQWSDGAENHNADTVIAGLYKNGVYADKYAVLNSAASWKGEFAVEELSGYTVKELQTDDSGTIEIAGSRYSPVEENSVITIAGKDYRAAYSETTEDITKTVTVTNHRLGSVTITKVDSKDQSIHLNGAEFKLQKNGSDVVDADGNVITVTTDENGNAVFDRLEPGTYTIIEIKAPDGYILPADGIQITVGENSVYEVGQTITNTKIYSLPESGGPGIYGFTISGVAILMTALLLFISNKRKEEQTEEGVTH